MLLIVKFKFRFVEKAHSGGMGVAKHQIERQMDKILLVKERKGRAR